jgi:hypothetical protein
MAMISRGIVPNLVISQRVVDRVVKASQHHIEDETGETMVGLVVQSHHAESLPTLYVLDTIAPDETVIRRSHMFEQGDEMQQDIFLWLLDNWNSYLEIGRDMGGKPLRPEWKVELKHLGDWHKQPGYMIQPSGGDLMTALNIMDDEENGFEFLLVPIVTLGHETVTLNEGTAVNYFSIPQEDGTNLRMDWWYIHRDVRMFQPLSPRIVTYDDLPQLTPYPWHILDRELLDEEVGLLRDDKKLLIGETTILWEVDGDLPLEICFIIGRTGWNSVFLVVTDWNYPHQKPRVHIAPFSNIDPTMYIYDVFGKLWKASSPAPEPADFKWNERSSYIVDYLAAIEKELGIRPENEPMPWLKGGGEHPGVVQIPVEVEHDADKDSGKDADGHKDERQ